MLKYRVFNYSKTRGLQFIQISASPLIYIYIYTHTHTLDYVYELRDIMY